MEFHPLAVCPLALSLRLLTHSTRSLTHTRPVESQLTNSVDHKLHAVHPLPGTMVQRVATCATTRTDEGWVDTHLIVTAWCNIIAAVTAAATTLFLRGDIFAVIAVDHS